jgi:hypothetical protein
MLNSHPTGLSTGQSASQEIVIGAVALAGKCLSVAVFFLLAVNSVQSWAFGVDGHRITVTIAENHLSNKTAAALAQISGGKPLAELALWPDQIRGAQKWSHTKPWHYINIKDQQRFADLRRSSKGDVLSALNESYKQLKDPRTGKQQRREALGFFLHLAGDIHQPLHVGRYSDLGGNRISIKWLGQKKRRNLHWVWDTGLIKTDGLDVNQYSAPIDRSTPEQRRNWQSDSFLDWAKESKRLRAQVYEFGQPARKGPITIDQNYIDRTKPLLQKRLLMAGIRLAGCLNRIFDSEHSTLKE